MPATLSPALIPLVTYDMSNEAVVFQQLHKLAPRLTWFCNCPTEYSIEDYNGNYTVMHGACNHRHGMNITGRMPKVEVDYPRLKAMVEMANLGLKASAEPNH